MRRVLQRLCRFWFDGEGIAGGGDEELRAVRAARRLAVRVGLIEQDHVRQEFDDMEREARALQRERQGR